MQCGALTLQTMENIVIIGLKEPKEHKLTKKKSISKVRWTLVKRAINVDIYMGG